MADSGVRDQEFLNDHQWIAAWKLPDRNEQTNTGEALTSEPKPRQRIATYDSAIEAHAGGRSKDTSGKAAVPPVAKHVSDDSLSMPQEQTDHSQSTLPPIRPDWAQRSPSQRLLSSDIEEPEPEKGSALRYAHQLGQVMTPAQYLARQQKYMAGRPPADNFCEGGCSALTPIFILGFTWAVYPGSFVKSIVSLLLDAAIASMYELWCKVAGQSRQAVGQQAVHVPYDVIPASQYVEAALARKAAAARLALQPISE